MKRETRKSAFLHSAAIIVGSIIIAPFLWMVIASLSPQSNLISKPVQWLPKTPYLERYADILFGEAGVSFRSAFLNTTIVATCTVIISMIVGIFGAYAFARLKFKFRRPVLMVFLATYMLPQISLLIPLYLILNSLNLLDTKLGLILVYCSLVIPFTLWILSNYFLSIPEEVEEQARIDGCSRVGALLRVILPSARPGIFAALMFAFLLAWDEFMYALIFTSSAASKTLTVAISEFAGRYTTDFGLVATGAIVASLPPILIAVVFQRYVVSGMSAGATKG